MTAAPINADDLIDEIKAGILRPTTRRVARALHQHMRVDDPLQIEALSKFRRGADPAEFVALLDQIWAKIGGLEPDQQSSLRLSICLIRPDEPVDWQIAEYIILWARQQGVSEHQITDAFKVGNGS
jgi:hypothetical protein